MITLKWSDTSYDELGFKIMRKAEDEDEFISIDTVSSNTRTYSDSDVSQDMTYAYKIRSYNDAEDSAACDQAAAKILWEPPTNLSVTNTSKDAVSLSWTDNSNVESGFEIQRRTISTSASDETNSDGDGDGDLGTSNTDTEGSDFAQIGTVGADVTKYTDTDVESNQTYAYKVRAYSNPAEGDSDGLTTDEMGTESAYSNEVEAETSEDFLCFIGTITHDSLKSATPLRTLRHICLPVFLLLVISRVISYRLKMVRAPLSKKHTAPHTLRRIGQKGNTR